MQTCKTGFSVSNTSRIPHLGHKILCYTTTLAHAFSHRCGCVYIGIGNEIRKKVFHHKSWHCLLLSLLSRTICFPGLLYKLTFNDRFETMQCGQSLYIFQCIITSWPLLGECWDLNGVHPMFDKQNLLFASHLSSVIRKKMFVGQCSLCAVSVSGWARLVMISMKRLLNEFLRT